MGHEVSWSYYFCLVRRENRSLETFGGEQGHTAQVGSQGQGRGRTLATASGRVLFFVQLLLSSGNPSCHFLERAFLVPRWGERSHPGLSCPWSWPLVFSLDGRPEAGTSEWWDGPLDGTEWYGTGASVLAFL